MVPSGDLVEGKQLTFNQAKELVKELVEKKGFSETDEALSQKLLWAFVELGEAANAFKKGEKWDVIIEELIDTLFYMLDFVHLIEKTQSIQIDLDKKFIEKWRINMTRPAHYGLRKDLFLSKSHKDEGCKKITIELTNDCFNRCVHCSAFDPDLGKGIYLDKDIIYSIIHDFASHGGEEINLSGGEPLLHPNFYEIANYSKERGLTVNVFTCGILSRPFNEERVNEHVEKIKRTKFNEVQITLHAPNEEMHDEITQEQGTFVNTIKFIEKLKSNGENIGVHFVPMDLNVGEFEDLVEYVQYLKLKRLNILRFYPQGRGRFNEAVLALTPETSAHLILKIMELSGNPEFELILGHPSDFRFIVNRSHNPSQCTAGISQCMIKVNGDVLPCPAFGELPDWIAGNIHEKPLSEIWNTSETFSKLRNFNHHRLKGECSVCPYLEKCRGRCPAERIRKNGGFYLGPDPSCPKELLQ